MGWGFMVVGICRYVENLEIRPRPRPRGDVRNMDQLHFQNGSHIFICILGPPLFVFVCL